MINAIASRTVYGSRLKTKRRFGAGSPMMFSSVVFVPIRCWATSPRAPVAARPPDHRTHGQRHASLGAHQTSGPWGVGCCGLTILSMYSCWEITVRRADARSAAWPPSRGTARCRSRSPTVGQSRGRWDRARAIDQALDKNPAPRRSPAGWLSAAAKSGREGARRGRQRPTRRRPAAALTARASDRARPAPRAPPAQAKPPAPATIWRRSISFSLGAASTSPLLSTLALCFAWVRSCVGCIWCSPWIA